MPLSKLSLSILKQLKDISGESQWLFPSPTGKTHIAGGAIDHALRKNLKLFKGIEEGFTPHDLRRTAASLKKEHIIVPIPLHGSKDLPIGTLKSIAKITGVKLS